MKLHLQGNREVRDGKERVKLCPSHDVGLAFKIPEGMQDTVDSGMRSRRYPILLVDVNFVVLKCFL